MTRPLSDSSPFGRIVKKSTNRVGPPGQHLHGVGRGGHRPGADGDHIQVVGGQRPAAAQVGPAGGIDQPHAVRGSADSGADAQHHLAPHIPHQGLPLAQGDHGEHIAGAIPALAQHLGQGLFHLRLPGVHRIVHHRLHLLGKGVVQVAQRHQRVVGAARAGGIGRGEQQADAYCRRGDLPFFHM